MGRSRSPSATRNHPLARGLSQRDAASVSTAAPESRRDVKLDDTPHYRTSARASERSPRTLHNSQVAGKKNSQLRSDRDSPRHRPPEQDSSRIRRVGVPAPAPDTDRTAPGGGIYPVRWPDNGDWRSVAANGGQTRGSPNCNSDPTDATARTSDHNPSKDRRAAPDATGRLAPIAPVGNAEMGPRGGKDRSIN